MLTHVRSALRATGLRPVPLARAGWRQASTDGKKPDAGAASVPASSSPPGDRGWTPGEFHSVEQILDEHVPPKERAQVKRVLYGLNQGNLVETLRVPAEAQAITI